MTAAIGPGNVLSNEYQNIYVEVGLDGSVMQATKVVRRDKITSWNEELQMYVFVNRAVVINRLTGLS